MTRRCLLAAPLAPFAALLLAACSPMRMPEGAAAKAADYPVSPTLAPSDAAPNDLESQIAALGAAEAQLDRAIHRRAPGEAEERVSKKEETSPVVPIDPSKPPPKAAMREGQKDVRAGSDGAAVADPCATACSALSSMERAAKHLCDLTGDADSRCDNARSRVSGAAERVNASCPVCPGSRGATP